MADVCDEVPACDELEGVTCASDVTADVSTFASSMSLRASSITDTAFAATLQLFSSTMVMEAKVLLLLLLLLLLLFFDA